jgi:hypothetical protein
MTSQSEAFTAAEHQERAFLEEQLYATQSEVKKISFERQKLLQKFKMQKKELQMVKDVSNCSGKSNPQRKNNVTQRR